MNVRREGNKELDLHHSSHPGCFRSQLPPSSGSPPLPNTVHSADAKTPINISPSTLYPLSFLCTHGWYTFYLVVLQQIIYKVVEQMLLFPFLWHKQILLCYRQNADLNILLHLKTRSRKDIINKILIITNLLGVISPHLKNS